jgi:hemerythrin-like domain-containing protein
MRHEDLFLDERAKIEQALDTLERVAARIDAGHLLTPREAAGEPTALLKEARRTVAFLTASEEAAYEASHASAGEPVLTVCLDEHDAARVLLRKLDAALAACERLDPGAGAVFARKARAYAHLRREHMKHDDRLFTHAPAARTGF